MVDFLVIGELLADVISTEYCDTLEEAVTFQRFQGGSPANVAANVKWLGKTADVIACVGNDGIGRFLLAEIERIGISAQYIQKSKALPTSIVLVTKSKGTPDFTAYRAADAQLQLVDEVLIESAAVLHTTAFALSLQPARGVIMNAFKKANTLGKTLSIDWNFAPSIWGEEDGKEVFTSIAAWRPFLKISVDDMERFVNKHNSVEAYKSMLGEYPFSFICLTCGKEGVWYKEAGEWQFKAALPVQEVVDTTGAGDAFWAGVLVACIEKRPVDDCVQNGLMIAAKKIQKKGPLYAVID